MFRFYGDYADVTCKIFCTTFTLDSTPHGLSDTIRACLSWVTGSKISQSDCDRYYKHIVSLLADTTQDQLLINTSPTTPTFYVYCENAQRHTVGKGGWIRAVIAQDHCLVNKSDCLPYHFHLAGSLLTFDTETCSVISFDIERNKNGESVYSPTWNNTVHESY